MSILVATLDAEISGAVLICSTSMRPLPLPVFADDDEANGFLAFAEGLGFSDVRRLRTDNLERLHDFWIEAGKPKEEEAPPLRLVTASS